MQTWDQDVCARFSPCGESHNDLIHPSNLPYPRRLLQTSCKLASQSASTILNELFPSANPPSQDGCSLEDKTYLRSHLHDSLNGCILRQLSSAAHNEYAQTAKRPYKNPLPRHSRSPCGMLSSGTVIQNTIRDVGLHSDEETSRKRRVRDFDPVDQLRDRR